MSVPQSSPNLYFQNHIEQLTCQFIITCAKIFYILYTTLFLFSLMLVNLDSTIVLESIQVIIRILIFITLFLLSCLNVRSRFFLSLNFLDLSNWREFLFFRLLVFNSVNFFLCLFITFLSFYFTIFNNLIR